MSRLAEMKCSKELKRDKMSSKENKKCQEETTRQIRRGTRPEWKRQEKSDDLKREDRQDATIRDKMGQKKIRDLITRDKRHIRQDEKIKNK